MTHWYAINTLPHQEARAETNLLRQGYRAWLPSITRSRRHARRIDTIVAPLFPGYLFVELDLERESWWSINGTYGVRRLLSHGDRPAPLPTDFIKKLQEMLDENGDVGVHHALQPGQELRVIAGPFVDCIGTLLCLAAKDRVSMLLSILGQEVSALVPRRMVLPVT